MNGATCLMSLLTITKLFALSTVLTHLLSVLVFFTFYNTFYSRFALTFFYSVFLGRLVLVTCIPGMFTASLDSFVNCNCNSSANNFESWFNIPPTRFSILRVGQCRDRRWTVCSCSSRRRRVRL